MSNTFDHRNVVRMTKNGPEPGQWVVIDIDGNILNTETTKTQGLNEGLKRANEVGAMFIVEGGGIRPPKGPDEIDKDDGICKKCNTNVIQCTEGIRIPPMQNGVVLIDGVTINIQKNVTEPGVWIDSCMLSRITINGPVAHQGNGPAVLIKPTKKLPGDIPASPVITESIIDIGAAVDDGGHETAVQIDTENGPILENRLIRFGEINCRRNSHGIRIVGQHKFIGNNIVVPHLHLNSGIGIYLIEGTVEGNNWNVSIQPTNNPKSTNTQEKEGGGGFLSKGSFDVINIGVWSIEGPVGIEGIKFVPGAKNNLVFSRKIEGIISLGDSSNKLLNQDG